MSAEQPPDQQDVERALGQKGLRLRFPRALEAAYLRTYLDQRAPMVPIWATVGTMFYCLAYLGDQTMMAANAELLFVLRFGIFLPYGIAVIILMRLFPSALLYEGLSVGVGLLGAILPMGVLAVTQSDYAYAYQTGTVSTLLFMVVLLRPRFYAVLTGCIGILAIQLVTTALNGSFDDVTYSGIITFYVTFTAFLVLAAFAMERAARRNFLQHLQNGMLAAQLRHQSEHDDLTGLNNRRALSLRLDQLWTRPTGAGRLAAIMLDIDHFKLYNDTHGHIAGDQCLRRVSQIVRDVIGTSGEAFRYGGEEILVLLPDASIAQVVSLAEDIRLAIRDAAIPHRHSSDPSGVITASLGAAEIDTRTAPASTLLSVADDALYQAKRLGRNRVFPPQPSRENADITASLPA
ncbi:MAG: GGDEF domain-containing protein [Devosia sp.]|jgi:diguanylate cyclase (GGDEF)-like protein|uniref:GGDEF domain-containing protein n=1 Tax=unclassified Devosia TaxID=196773 RepID=UPI001A07EF92|nr:MULTISPECIES: GGDEF domain-containing protein [unclassified Devosia]MBF0679087.1 GGDEF domain-containing protein [Devosia sp.]WEJ33702.1 GGDEF domain-containing protein [Devosia sp. SD17-2]